jgi:hypothetical protein
LDTITNLTADLVMGLHAFTGVYDLFVKRMTELPDDLDHDGFGHLVACDLSNDSTTIVHALPSVVAAL